VAAAIFLPSVALVQFKAHIDTPILALAAVYTTPFLAHIFFGLRFINLACSRTCVV
jgi:hypothetical protein